MTIDIKNFYLNTPMERFEYMRLKLSNLPDDFVERYNLEPKEEKTDRSTSRSDEECMDIPK